MATIDKLKMLLGGITAIGHVHEDASYGFDFIIGTLTTMGGAFANWAFGAASAAKNRAPVTGGESQEIVKP